MKEVAPRLVVGGAIISAVQVIPYADVVIDTALIAQAGYHLVKDGELSNEDWINIATIGLARGVSKIKFSKVTSKLSKVDDYAGNIHYFGAGELGIASVDDFARATKIEKGHLTSSSVDDLAKLAEVNPESGVVTLGPYGKGEVTSYEQVAYRNGNTSYNLGNDGWNAVEQPLRDAGLTKNQINDEMWKINQKFLDNQMAAGKEFSFTSDPRLLDKKTFGGQEFSYLSRSQNGYKLEKIGDEWRMIK